MKKLALILAISIATLAFTKNETTLSISENRDTVETPNILSNGQTVADKLLELELTKENLATVLKFYGVKCPEVVYQQAILESGNFTSYLCRKNNNLFGMYHPGKGRLSTSTGPCKYGYATFEHWTKSVEDYKYWQDMFAVETDDYYSYLTRRGYAESKVYIQRLKTIQPPTSLRSL